LEFIILYNWHKNIHYIIYDQRQETLDLQYLTLLCGNLKKWMFLQNFFSWYYFGNLLCFSNSGHHSTILQTKQKFMPQKIRLLGGGLIFSAKSAKRNSQNSVRKKSFGGKFTFSNCHIIGLDTVGLVFLVYVYDQSWRKIRVGFLEFLFLNPGLISKILSPQIVWV
jgi:hypothetical protein